MAEEGLTLSPMKTKVMNHECGGAMNPKVDLFIMNAKRWQAEYRTLRAILLGCGLTEELKWGVPCYALEGKNIALMHGFKEYCAILFIKGSLMKDPEGILVAQTANVQAGRQVRFTDVHGIKKCAPLLKTYIGEAIEIERSGRKVPLKKTTEFAVPDEFKKRMDADAALKKAFGQLTPGRQRAYLLYFSSAKQARTREDRVGKCAPRILGGKGLDD